MRPQATQWFRLTKSHDTYVAKYVRDITDPDGANAVELTHIGLDPGTSGYWLCTKDGDVYKFCSSVDPLVPNYSCQHCPNAYACKDVIFVTFEGLDIPVGNPLRYARIHKVPQDVIDAFRTVLGEHE